MQGAGGLVRGGSDGRPGLVLWDGDVVVRRVILGAAIREIMVDASEGWRESGGEGLRGVDLGCGCGSKRPGAQYGIRT